MLKLISILTIMKQTSRKKESYQQFGVKLISFYSLNQLDPSESPKNDQHVVEQIGKMSCLS